jgi:hypothetical protein
LTNLKDLLSQLKDHVVTEETEGIEEIVVKEEIVINKP